MTKAIYDYWQYYAPVAKYGPKKYIAAQKTSTHSYTHMVDKISSGKKDKSLTKVLKNAFGLGNVTHDDDFANQLASGSVSTERESEVASDEFYNYCADISSTGVLCYIERRKGRAIGRVVGTRGHGVTSVTWVNHARCRVLRDLP